MFSGGWIPGGSVASIDTARTNERLSAFLSKLIEEEPVDGIFVEIPLLKYFMENKEVDSYGRQVMFPFDRAKSPNGKFFGDTDTFNTAIKDTVVTAVFPLKNYGITINIGWEEKMEAFKSDVRAYDIVKHRKDSAMMTAKDDMASAVVSAAPPAIQPFGLPKLIDTTSTDVGGIDRTVITQWQAQVSTAVGAFAANGLSTARTLWNNIKKQGLGVPDAHVMHQTVHESFESELDPDIRYAQVESLDRGAQELIWKGAPAWFEPKMAVGEWYMLNKNLICLCVDEDANFTIDPFLEPVNSKISTAKILFRHAIIVKNPRGLGKMTGIS